MPSGIGSRRRSGNNGGFVANKPLDAWIALCVAWGCGVSTSGLAINETRHVNTALLIADTDFVLPAVIALKY